jgi:ribose transport system substrate-binding protein
VKHLRDSGTQVDKRIDTGVHVATPENMNQPEIQALLRPPIDQYL